MARKILKLCIVGFGNAGREFCRLLQEKRTELIEYNDCEIRVNEIITQRRGSLRNTDGINITEALEAVEETDGFFGMPYYCSQSTLEMIADSGADVLVELSTLSVMDGQPAIRHIEAALKKDMHVVTANKGPIAWSFNELSQVAESRKRSFLYETTVMDGTPIFNLVRNSLPGCKMLSFKGILNTTTNFILGEMEKGNSFDSAVKEAQRRGFAEADPTLDIEGWDAAAKTAALLNVLLGAGITPLDIDRKGITDITNDEIQVAKQNGKCIKLMCEGRFENGKPIGKVYPCEISQADIYSRIDATSSILTIETDLMGEVSIMEHNPEIRQTAYGIYSDILTLIKDLK